MHGSWKAGGVAVLATLVSVTLAYQVPAVLELDLGRSFPSALAIDNFHDTEQGYRWTRGQSRIVFRDPGASQRAQIDVELSGFRPPGQPPPLVVVEATGETARFESSRRIAWYSLATTTRGWWSSDLEIRLRSETFSPGAGDERALGVRVQRVRLTLPGGTLPPLRQLLLSLIIVAIVFDVARRRSAPTWIAAAAGITLGIAFAWSRTITPRVVPALAAILIATILARILAPATVQLAANVARAIGSSLGESIVLLARRRSVAIAAATVAGVWAAYAVTPVVELDVGAGTSLELARRFGPLDRAGDTTFRRALAGASIDLRDFGSSSPWTVRVIASVRGGVERATLMQAGGQDLVADVSPEWTAYELHIPPAPPSWRGGHVLVFPGPGAGSELFVDRIEIDRGASVPGVRGVAVVLAAVLLVSAALHSTLAGAVFLGFVATALASVPAVAVPFLPTLLIGCVATFVLAAAARGVLRIASRRDFLPEIAPAAISVALAGFVVWFVAIASPLYVGGHYGYHTDIAEEIWQGQFLHYYLPYPGSMLSRQPQWDNLIVPHSCLFHTLVAPLAALPRPWFHLLTKLFLASLLSGISLSAALVATRIGGLRTGVYAAMAATLLPTGSQLLGLGHLMTLFGTWASTLALGFIVIHTDKLTDRLTGRLTDRRVLVTAIGLMALCCLSYTGSLLFASTVLIACGALLLSSSKPLARRLALVVVAGWGLSFLLYYIHWTVPFLRDSLPALMTGSGSDTSIDVWARVRSQPGKMAYTFGSFLVPVVGLMGLAVAKGARRTVLVSWGAILIGFSGVDILFNFLLKHHYFTYPVIGIGIGLALGWLHEKSWLARVITALWVVFLVWMGVREAFAVARGAI